jgi:hypothetical protein
MKRFLQSGLVITAGILGLAAVSDSAGQDVPVSRKKFDLREAVLRRFFKDNQCPAEEFAGIFVAEADAHGLDWRLLPSLAFVESGAGKHYMYNNMFGWANGTVHFGSVSEAIHMVAIGLAEARPYRNKDIGGKLRAYNGNLGYEALVSGVMRRIAPSVQLVAAAE